MSILRVYYLPNDPDKYVIQWKRSTENSYANDNKVTVTKSSNAEQTVDITIPDTVTDWDVMISAQCGDVLSGTKTYRVRAECETVTYDVIHCICSAVGDMSIQTT